MKNEFLTAKSPLSVDYFSIPALDGANFSDAVSSRLSLDGRLIALMAVPLKGGVEVVAAVARDGAGSVELFRMSPATVYPSIAARFGQAHGLERALYEEWGIEPEGHPWLKPLRKIDLEIPLPGDASFYRIDGEEIHEVAVGPVHAGIIEPGHFRFQCHGEKVFHLEIRLGYQHRGALRFLLGKPSPRWASVAESITGDTAVGGALAHALCLEALSGGEAPPRAQFISALALELERLAYHVGDLGALGNDVGFLPTAQYNGRIRGDFLNCLMTISGNRHGRGLIRHGGVLADLDQPMIDDLLRRIELHHSEARKTADLLLDAPSVMARFDGTGTVTKEAARAIGLVGLAARASGLEMDSRIDHAFGAYRFQQISIATGYHGDVHARAVVRSIELDRSAKFCQKILKSLPKGPIMRKAGALKPDSLGLAMVEGWRGELVHVKATGEDGRVIAAQVVDPSVHNWHGLALALRNQEISDFPLCNKSFNLAYAGHDL